MHEIDYLILKLILDCVSDSEKKKNLSKIEIQQ